MLSFHMRLHLLPFCFKHNSQLVALHAQFLAFWAQAFSSSNEQLASLFAQPSSCPFLAGVDRLLSSLSRS